MNAKRYVLTTWYEDRDGTRYCESAPDFISGDLQKHRKGAFKFLGRTRPDFDIVPARAVAKVKIEPY